MPNGASGYPGTDEGYDSVDFVMELREKAVTPHLAQNQERAAARRSMAASTRHPGYAISQRIRRRIEGAFGWVKTVAGFARCSIVACPRSIGNSPWRWPLTILCACPNCSPRRRYDRRNRRHRYLCELFVGYHSVAALQRSSPLRSRHHRRTPRWDARIEPFFSSLLMAMPFRSPARRFGNMHLPCMPVCEKRKVLVNRWSRPVWRASLNLVAKTIAF
jgi:hypothetical protein